MWIKDQDNLALINTNNIVYICADINKVSKTGKVTANVFNCDKCYLLGTYATVDKAKEVVAEIANAIKTKSKLYQMPEE